MSVIYVILAVVSGLFTSVQGPANTALSKRTDKFQATSISFLGGTVMLGVLVLTVGNGDLSKITGAQFWQLLGGVYGVYCVCIAVFAIPEIGVALMTTAIMLGQLTMGTIIDHFGLFLSKTTDVSYLRVAGIFIVAVGIIVIYFGSKPTGKNSAERNSKRIEMVSLCFLAGIAGAIQSPTNASLGRIVGRWEGTFVSFSVGLVLIFLITLIISKGKLKPLKGVGIKPWMLIGGPIGACVVFLNLYTVSYVGTALQVACAMTGQLVGGIVVDSFGLLQSEKIEITPLRAAGVLIVAIGVILITISKML